MKKIDYNAPVVLTFALISLIVLILQTVTGGASTTMFFCVYRSSPLSVGFWIRLFGHVLGHADLQHYTGNMMLLLLLGPMLEEKYGSRQLLICIVATAVLTGALNMLLFPRAALLGASGIVFMMMIMASVTGLRRGKIPLTLIVVAVIYIGQEIAAGVFSSDNISQLTHIAGGICGGGFGLYFGKRQS